MVEVGRCADDAACRRAGCNQSWLLCLRRRRAVAVATKWLGVSDGVGGSYGGLCGFTLRAAADSGQFGAAIHAGVFSVADCLGELPVSRVKSEQLIGSV